MLQGCTLTEMFQWVLPIGSEKCRKEKTLGFVPGVFVCLVFAERESQKVPPGFFISPPSFSFLLADSLCDVKEQTDKAVQDKRQNITEHN